MTYSAYQFPTHFSEFVSEQGRKQLTKMVMRLLKQWDLTTAEQLKLLGLRETSRNMLARYRNLETVIPFDQDKLTRAGLLLAIYKNLYDLYPDNKVLRDTWVKRSNAMLSNKRPLDLMLENGLFGMAKVMRFLDFQKVT